MMESRGPLTCTLTANVFRHVSALHYPPPLVCALGQDSTAVKADVAGLTPSLVTEEASRSPRSESGQPDRSRFSSPVRAPCESHEARWPGKRAGSQAILQLTPAVSKL